MNVGWLRMSLSLVLTAAGGCLIPNPIYGLEDTETDAGSTDEAALPTQTTSGTSDAATSSGTGSGLASTSGSATGETTTTGDTSSESTTGADLCPIAYENDYSEDDGLWESTTMQWAVGPELGTLDACGTAHWALRADLDLEDAVFGLDIRVDNECGFGDSGAGIIARTAFTLECSEVNAVWCELNTEADEVRVGLVESSCGLGDFESVPVDGMLEVGAWYHVEMQTLGNTIVCTVTDPRGTLSPTIASFEGVTAPLSGTAGIFAQTATVSVDNFVVGCPP